MSDHPSELAPPGGWIVAMREVDLPIGDHMLVRVRPWTSGDPDNIQPDDQIEYNAEVDWHGRKTTISVKTDGASFKAALIKAQKIIRATRLLNFVWSEGDPLLPMHYEDD